MTTAVIFLPSWSAPSCTDVWVAPGIGVASANHCTVVEVCAGCQAPPATVSTPPTFAKPLTVGCAVVRIVPGATAADAAETEEPVT